MRLIGLSILLLLSSIPLISQVDAHYWTHQYGSQGLLLNGAVIAGTQGETALFYNPGAVGMSSTQGLELSFVTPTYFQLRTSNLLGDDNVINDRSIDLGPGFAGATFKPWENKKITMGVTTFQRFKTDISFQDRAVEPINDGTTLIFRGDLDFDRQISEQWVGINFAYNPSPNLGIGLTQFSTFHRQSTSFDLKREITSINDPEDLLQSFRSEFSYGINVNSAFVSKLGLTYRSDLLRLGLTYTSPSYGAIIKRGDYSIEDQRINILTNTNQSVSNRNTSITSQRRTPSSFGFGLDLLLDDTSYSFSAEYFTAISSYLTLVDEDDPFDSNSNVDLPTSIEISESTSSVLNFAIGCQRKFSETLTCIVGFRTDFDQSNIVLINEFPEYIGAVGNVYHLSGGGLFNKKKNNFSIGMDLGFGRRTGGNQLANFNNVDQSSLFDQTGEPVVNSTFVSLMLFCTYDFIFSSFSEK